MRKFNFKVLFIIVASTSILEARNIKFHLREDTINLGFNKFYVSEVVDNRTNKTDLGSYFDEYGEKFTFNTKLSLQEEVYNYISKSLISQKIYPLKLTILECRINRDNVLKNEQCFLKVEISDANDSSGLSKMIYSTTSGAVALKGYSGMLRGSINICLKKHHFYMRTKTIVDTSIVKKAYQGSVYLNFEDYTNAKSNNINIEEYLPDNKFSDLAKSEYRYKIELKNYPLKDFLTSEIAYAFSDGVNEYISLKEWLIDANYAIVKKKTPGLILIEAKITDQGTIGASYILFGLAGGIVAAALTEASKERLSFYIDIKRRKCFVPTYDYLERVAKSKPAFNEKLLAVDKTQVEKDINLWIENFYELINQ